MTDEKIRRLNRYNQSFYSDYGTAFARSREYFWPSWYTFLQHSDCNDIRGIQVADIGCGSGRFALFLEDQWAFPFTYWGTDVSQVLLDVAQSDLMGRSFEFVLLQQDIVENILDSSLQIPSRIDLAVLFGVLHHIPGQKTRITLLQAIWERLEVGGELWFTIWSPLKAKDATAPDVLLGWHEDPTAERYVHWLSEVEETEILQALSHSQILARWYENRQGERGNICLLLKKLEPAHKSENDS